MRDSFNLAIKNVASYGDTDVFPFPIENRIFSDKPDAVHAQLQAIHDNFDEYLNRYAPVNQSALSPAGYTGFRWATQIDPLWNAYLLSLVIQLGKDIEGSRIPVERDVVFSYRFAPNEQSGALFDTSHGWRSFQAKSIEQAKKYPWVLVCDIADFYSRIYHHRLENALLQLSSGGGIHKRIMTLLQKFSNNASYGLPVGGPAARLLSELVLNRTDRLLASDGLKFCRFADDYHIFAESEEDAYRHLVYISEKLLVNEGLSLQKMKTRIMSSREFLASSELDDEDSDQGDSLSLLRLSLQFDPYSATAVEDYETLQKEIEKIDISGLLTKELRKSRVHGPTTRKIIQAIKFLPVRQKRDAILSMIRSLETLAPVFGAVMLAIKEAHAELDDQTRVDIGVILGEFLRSNSHLAKIDMNIAFALRVVALKRSDELESTLAQLYRSTTSEVVKRDILLVMAKWRASYWVSDRKSYFHSMGAWERRAFIIASYLLGDEGKHWRDHIRDALTPFELTVRDWASQRVAGRSFEELPI